ncbi:DExH-box splicing factor binding site-domain-containing protein [Flagelloscypha sp. PMI_526]|nr:DExH-box splicing factor binding site-domain-containing protein [Flagelloscypha sp. PMI_526]
MNSGPELTGLQVPVRRIEQVDRDNDVPMAPPSTEDTEPESEDAAALRAIIAESSGQPSSHITIAPAVSEKEAFEQDVDELPESSTLAQYDRMPIEQFGAALLRGMGWTPGTAATKKKGKGMVEPWIPEARPALLGIGAKEREPLDDGSNRKKGRPDKKYVPLILRDRDGGRDREHSRRSRSRSPHSRHESRSRRSSRSPPPKRRDYEKDDRRSGSSRRDDYRERDKREDYREKDRPSHGDRNSRKY